MGEHRAPTQDVHIPPLLSWPWAHLSLTWLTRTLVPSDLPPAIGCLQTSPSPCDLPSNSSPPFFLLPSQMVLRPGKGKPIPTTASWPGPPAVTSEGWEAHQVDRALRTRSILTHYGNARHNASLHMTDLGMPESPAHDNSLGLQPSHYLLSAGLL